MHDCMVLVSGFQIHQAERAIFFKCRPLCRIANSLNCWNCWIFFNAGCRTWQHHCWTGSWELWVQFSIHGSVAVSGLGGLEKWGKWAMRGVLIEPPARCCSACSAHSLLPSINMCFHIFTFDIWQETDIYKIKRIGAKWLLLTSTQHQSHCLLMH